MADFHTMPLKLPHTSSFRETKQEKQTTSAPGCVHARHFAGGSTMTPHVEQFGDLRLVECDGRIVRSDAAFALRDSVIGQSDARTIILDLSDVVAIEGGGWGMLMFLRQWAEAQNIELKVFNPRNSVRTRLERSPLGPFEIISSQELLELLGREGHVRLVA
jgi:anti-anti-sigma regulatory factor